MATIVRKISALIAQALVTPFNQLRLDLLKLKVGTVFHADSTAAIATANASSLETSVALVNTEKAWYNAHCASACSATTGQGAHIAADAANTVATADATDLASGITLGNAIKAKYNTHRAATAYHPTADATNTIASADATDQASLNTLLNEIKTDMSAHGAAALTSQAISVVPA